MDCSSSDSDHSFISIKDGAINSNLDNAKQNLVFSDVLENNDHNENTKVENTKYKKIINWKPTISQSIDDKVCMQFNIFHVIY
ncbi:unnamed protein product [Gordionus sp. m RMFG-2023]